MIQRITNAAAAVAAPSSYVAAQLTTTEAAACAGASLQKQFSAALYSKTQA
jgi:hypothetical protein